MRRSTAVERLGAVALVAYGTLAAGTMGMAAREASPGHLLATISVGNGPSAVAVSARLRRAYVLMNARYTPGAISVIDTGSGAVLRTAEVDQGPQALAVDDGADHVFVSTVGSAGSIDAGAVTMLDSRTVAPLRRVPVHHPVAMALDPRTHHLFVLDASGSGSAVLVLDTRTGLPIRSLHTGLFPFAVAVDTRTSRAFVVNFADATVSVLDTRTGRELRAVGLGPTWPRSGSAATAAAVDERAGRVYVTALQGRFLYMLDGQTGALLRTVGVGPNPLGIGVDSRRGRVVVSSEGPTDERGNPVRAGEVRWLDAGTGTSLGTLRVGAFPAALAIDSASGRAVVCNLADASVSIVDVRRHVVLQTVAIKAARVAGVDPLQQAVAVDEGTGHAFAVNLGEAHVTMLDAGDTR